MMREYTPPSWLDARVDLDRSVRVT